MPWRRGCLAAALLLISMVACDHPDPLASSFMVVIPPASLAATAFSFNQINLTWQDNSSNETGFEVYRSTTGPSGAFALLATTGSRVSSYSDFGVAGETQYCYEVRTFRTTGRKNNYSDFSNVTCATTPRSLVPLAASGVTAVPQDGYVISIAWTDNSTDEVGFRVERSPSAGGPWTSIGASNANATTLYDYQVAVEQGVCYRVFAFNTYGASDASNVDCTAMPAAPSNLAASVANASADLTWTDNSSVEDGFDVLRSGGADWSVVAHLPANASRYQDANLADGAYLYFVRASRDGGASGTSNVVQVVVATVAPLAPINLDAAPFSSNGVSVSWANGSTNQDGFRVERSTDDGTSWVAAGNAGVNDTSFGDYPVPSEQPVCYRVIAFNRLGESPPSISDCTTPPAGPTDVTATGLDDVTIRLAWTDNSAVEDGYQVLVDDGYGNQLLIASLDANTTTFDYVDYYADYYYYSVVAVKDGGYSDWSDWVYPTAPAGVSSVRAGLGARGSPSKQPLLRARPREKP